MYTIARMLQIFDNIENLESGGPIKMHHTIENRSATGVRVRLHLASSSFDRFFARPMQTDLELDPDHNLGLGVDR